MKKTTRTALILLTFTSTLALPLSSHAGIKCWTNKQGVRECGNVVPPEYSQQETRTINKRGMTTEITERAKTREELEAEKAKWEAETAQREEEERRQAEEENRRKEQETNDRVLLATFLTEEDIIRSRDRKLSAIDGTIELARITRDKLLEKLEREQKNSDRYQKQGKPLPETLRNDIESLNKQIDDKESYIASKVRERQELMDKYDADLKRFRVLKAEGRRLR